MKAYWHMSEYIIIHLKKFKKKSTLCKRQSLLFGVDIISEDWYVPVFSELHVAEPSVAVGVVHADQRLHLVFRVAPRGQHCLRLLQLDITATVLIPLGECFLEFGFPENEVKM